MTVPQNFRTAFRGFHREDVVQYLEFIHNRHAQQIGELQQECAQLRGLLDQPHPAQEELDQLRGEADQLRQEKEELEQRRAELEQRCAELEERLAQAPEPPAQEGAIGAQLQSYRRADRVEREAQERSELVYYQAKAVLREATGKVDAAAQEITGLADTVMGQLTQLQMAVSASKQTLQDAASILDAIRPNP